MTENTADHESMGEARSLTGQHSAVLHELLQAHKRARAEGGGARLVISSTAVRRVFTLHRHRPDEQLGCERTTVIRWERAETEPQPWVRPRPTHVLQLTAQELSELLADVADVPGKREGFTLVTSVPMDFSLSAAYTVRIMEGFSAHDIASRREALAGLAVITGTALLGPVRHWATSFALLTGSPPEVGTDEVGELEQAVSLFRRWDASGAGGLRRKAVVGQLNAVAETLTGHHPAAITQRLFQVTANSPS